MMRGGDGSETKEWDWTVLDGRRREKSDKAKDEEGMEEWNRMIDTAEIDDLDKVADLQREEEVRAGKWSNIEERIEK